MRHGWPATDGAGASDRAVSKAGNKVGTLLRNPPPVGGSDLWICPRGDCCRSDALRGVGFGENRGVSKVSMGAISLSLGFPPLPLAHRLGGHVEGLGELLLGQPPLPPGLGDQPSPPISSIAHWGLFTPNASHRASGDLQPQEEAGLPLVQIGGLHRPSPLRPTNGRRVLLPLVLIGGLL